METPPEALSSTVVVAIVGGIAAMATAVVAFFGGKGSAAAQLQASLNDTARLLLEKSQADTKRCEEKLAAQDRKIEQQNGEIANLQQQVLSFMEILRRAGHDVPKYRPTAVVFTPIEDLRED